MASGIECFGNPPGLQGLGGELARTGTGLDQICADARQEVSRLLPNWQGPASDDFRPHIANQLAAALRMAGTARRFSGTVFTLERGLAAAMEQFQLAESAAMDSGVVIMPSLLVVATSPKAQGAVPIVQEMVNNARDMAEKAQTDAMTALDAVEESDTGLWGAVSMLFGGGRGGGRTTTPRPTSRPNVPVRPPPAAPKPAVDWAKLEKAAEEPVARKKDNGFSSWTAEDGRNRVTIVEGNVSDPISQKQSLAKYVETIQGEHATHAVGMQLGENVHEGLTSGPAAGLNLGPMLNMESAIRDVYDRGAIVGTRTTLHIEDQTINGESIPVLVGIKREAWIRPPGTDGALTFATFNATIDPVTREVTILKNDVTRP